MTNRIKIFIFDGCLQFIFDGCLQSLISLTDCLVLNHTPSLRPNCLDF